MCAETELGQLGAKIVEAKVRAPTRPHPAVAGQAAHTYVPSRSADAYGLLRLGGLHPAAGIRRARTGAECFRDDFGEPLRRSPPPWICHTGVYGQHRLGERPQPLGSAIQVAVA